MAAHRAASGAAMCPAPVSEGGPKNPAMERMVLAQSLWDASMAWKLAGALREGTVDKIVHVCGRFHVEHGLGIPEHLDRYLLQEHCEHRENKVAHEAAEHLREPGGAFRAIAKTA